LILSVLADLVLQIYQTSWKLHPEIADLGEQVFLNAVSIWNTEVMMSSSRKMFNLSRGVWGRIAAWAEWASVSTDYELDDWILVLRLKKAEAPTSERPFMPSTNQDALKTAIILLATAQKAVPTPDVLWLHLAIYLAAGMEDEALDLVRLDTDSLAADNGQSNNEIGEEAGIARSHYRMLVVEEIHRRRVGRSILLDVRSSGSSSSTFNGSHERIVDFWKPEWNWASSRLIAGHPA